MAVGEQTEQSPNEAGAVPGAISPEAAGHTVAEGRDRVVALRGITKAYGPTVANRDLNVEISPGEIVGLVGANGAGKSTLMRILCGVTEPDEGDLSVGGSQIQFARFSPRDARRRGIRIVHQELSLCTNLSVTENFFLEDAQIGAGGVRWHAHYSALARASIERVFPNSAVDMGATVGDLPIAQRQMVEIARAACAPHLKLLILDEPTSSLDSERSVQLRRYLDERARQDGLCSIFISHRLAEVVAVASRVLVMRSGEMVWQGASSEASVARLVEWMGGEAESRLNELRSDTRADTMGLRHGETRDGATQVSIGGRHLGPEAEPISLCRGEVVGFAGLEGSGQKELLHRIFEHAGAEDVQCRGSVGFVAGDRQTEGVFPLWSVLENIAIGQTSKRRALSPAVGGESLEDGPWLDRLRLDRERLPAPILELSGGNQQKALVARTLFADADVILLDDPTRGVDVAVKRDFYGVVRELADAGKLVIWYSSEDLEFLECDRVLVFRDGEIVSQLDGQDISEESIVNSSFLEPEADQAAASEPRQSGHAGDWRQWLFRIAPFLSTVAIFSVIGSMNPMALSSFGLDLLLGPATPLVLIAAAQMFVVGGSQIDLGVGAFAGLINVLSATVLVSEPGQGVLVLMLALAGYGAIGALIEGRRLPAIVVTLGASFIWLGIGYSIQDSPGGSSPAWLTAAFSWSALGVPAAVVLIAAAGVAVWAVNRSRVGVVLRGLGNNAQALKHMGWSAFRYTIGRYLIAGAFALLAGLSLTAVNTASDINASSTFTLLSVAAVVIGGCRLVGGVVSPIGIVFGALTLSLIGALLGFLGISTDYNAAVQGALLIGILALRTLVRTDGAAS